MALHGVLARLTVVATLVAVVLVVMGDGFVVPNEVSSVVMTHNVAMMAACLAVCWYPDMSHKWLVRGAGAVVGLMVLVIGYSADMLSPLSNQGIVLLLCLGFLLCIWGAVHRLDTEAPDSLKFFAAIKVFATLATSQPQVLYQVAPERNYVDGWGTSLDVIVNNESLAERIKVATSACESVVEGRADIQAAYIALQVAWFLIVSAIMLSCLCCSGVLCLGSSRPIIWLRLDPVANIVWLISLSLLLFEPECRWIYSALSISSIAVFALSNVLVFIAAVRLNPLHLTMANSERRWSQQNAAFIDSDKDASRSIRQAELEQELATADYIGNGGADAANIGIVVVAVKSSEADAGEGSAMKPSTIELARI